MDTTHGRRAVTSRGSGRVLPRAILLVAAATVAAACGTPTVQVTASPLPEEAAPASVVPTPTPLPTPSATPSPSPTPTGRFPLTGEATDRPRTGEPVLAVKIDNARAAFPQAGLDQADIVYEAVVEGGVTRFLALFHSQTPSEIGPVRSARLVDAEVLAPYHPVLASSGARPEVAAAIAGTDAIGLVADRGGSTFFRQSGRSSPHNLMARTDQVLARGAGRDEVEPASSGLVWGVLPGEGSVGTQLSIRMSPAQVTSWEYDQEADVYRRFSNGSSFEVTGGGQIGAANVVVVLTDIETGGCCDSAGQSYVETRMTGTGDAVLLRHGRRFPATWSKSGRDGHLLLLDPDGAPLPLAPGVTWIHLAPNGAVG